MRANGSDRGSNPVPRSDLLPRVIERTTRPERHEYLFARAARLNCYGETFAEMRECLGGLEPATETDEHRRLQAELNAAAFHAYGLDREQTAFVLEDFHRVQNPRVMDEDYFDSVSEYYGELAKSGPLP